MTLQKPYKVDIVDHNPQWASLFLLERASLLASTGSHFVELEHIGSTAVPNQRAKPIIDMMGALQSLDELATFLPALNTLGYQLIDAGMSQRYFLRKQLRHGEQTFHLHIVEVSTWAERKERLMRDYLLNHPDAVQAYGNLKAQNPSQNSAKRLAIRRIMAM